MYVEMVWKMASLNKEFVMVRYKFKYEDTVIVKQVSKDDFQELKDAFTIEYCELINWYNIIPISLNYFKI